MNHDEFLTKLTDLLLDGIKNDVILRGYLCVLELYCKLPNGSLLIFARTGEGLTPKQLKSLFDKLRPKPIPLTLTEITSLWTQHGK